MADNGAMSTRYPHLARHRIPYDIIHTDTLVSWLMKIAETKPFLDEYLGSPMEIKLLRRARVRAITYSNQIEGNPLGESEVTAVLAGKRIAGSKEAVAEVQNYHEALDYVESLVEGSRSIRLADMCDLQKLVTRGQIADKFSGRVRMIPVSIVNAATGEKIEECPAPHELKDLLDDLWRWLDDTKSMNPFARAFSFHFIAVAIHPFADGNGRTVRLMQHLLLLLGGERVARFVPSETAIMRKRDRYYSSIRQSRALGSLHPIVEFLAECFAEAAAEVVADGRKFLKEQSGRTPDARQQKILSYAKGSDSFSMADVVSWMPDVPRRTLERDVAALVKKRALKSKGELKSRVYQLASLKKK